MFVDEIKVLGTANSDDFPKDLDKVNRWSVKYDLPLNLSKFQLLTEREANPSRHAGPPRHQVVVEQVQQARERRIVMIARFNLSRSNRMPARRRGVSCANNILLPFKVFTQMNLEYTVGAQRPYLVRIVKMLELGQYLFTQ